MQEVRKNLGIIDEPVLDQSDFLWKKFAEKFWILFFAHLGIKYSLPFFFPTENPPWASDFIVYVGISSVPILLMVATVAYYAYKFSGKKSYLLYGLLGFVWLGTISIFLSYAAIRNLYKVHKGRVVPVWESVVFWIFTTIIVLLFAFVAIDSFVNLW